jgi:hypothetical protein
MALDDPSNYLSTPAEYATKNQLDAAREYAKYLLAGGGQQPVKHWTQGLSNMVSALVGGYGNYRAGQRENYSRQLDSAAQVPQLPGVEGATNAQPNALTDPSMALAARGTAGVETSGEANPYTAKGPKTRDGDNAYGKYQVKGSNIGPWSKEILGKEMSPQEFLANPDAQEQIYHGKYGQFLKKYGNYRDADSMWFSNKPYAQGKDLTDKTDKYPGLTGAQYAAHALAARGGAAVPFSGQPAPEAGGGSDAQGGITNALAAARSGSPSIVAPPPGMGAKPAPAAAAGAPTGQYVAPSTAPYRVPISREQMIRVMSSSWIPDDQKSAMLQQYYQQGQPVEAKVPGGSVVIGRDGIQRPVPDIHWTDMEAGGAKISAPQTTMGGAVTTLPQTGMPSAAGAAAPAGPAPTTSTAKPASPAAEPNAQMPNLLKFNSEGGGTSEGATGGAGPGGMLSPPPAAAAAAGTKVAQAIPPQLEDLANWGIKKAAEKEQQTELAKKDAENYSKNSNELMTLGRSAQQLLPQISLAKQYIHDPKFITGTLSGPRTEWARLKATIGLDPQAAAVSEAFDKLKASGVLGQMKSTLQGLGQVRNAEIDLLDRANAARGNTLPSNQAILDITERSAKQVDNLSKIVSDYGNGIRWDKDGNAYKGNDPPTNAGLQDAIKRFVEAHPIYTDEEIKNYNKIFELDENTGKNKAGALGKAPPKLPPAPEGIPQNFWEEIHKRGLAGKING